MENKIIKSVFAVSQDSALANEIDLDSAISSSYRCEKDLVDSMKQKVVSDYKVVHRRALYIKNSLTCVGLGLTRTDADRDLERDVFFTYGKDVSTLMKEEANQ